MVGHTKEDSFIPLSLKLIDHDNIAMNHVIIRTKGRLIKEGRGQAEEEERESTREGKVEDRR